MPLPSLRPVQIVAASLTATALLSFALGAMGTLLWLSQPAPAKDVPVAAVALMADGPVLSLVMPPPLGEPVAQADKELLEDGMPREAELAVKWSRRTKSWPGFVVPYAGGQPGDRG